MGTVLAERGADADARVAVAAAAAASWSEAAAAGTDAPAARSETAAAGAEAAAARTAASLRGAALLNDLDLARIAEEIAQHLLGLRRPHVLARVVVRPEAAGLIGLIDDLEPCWSCSTFPCMMS